MVLTVLKNCGKWDVVAGVFSIKAPTFERMVIRFLSVLLPILYDLYVTPLADRYTMLRLQTSNNAFRFYPCARYATEITFQQSNMPAGTQAERSEFYSAKHKQHGFKVEVSVLPNGLAINCTDHYRGSFSDITIFRRNMEFHRVQLHKLDAEQRVPDDGPMQDVHDSEWAVLVDKGYQGLPAVIRAIHPRRKPSGHRLSSADEETNRKISSDRIIVENFFGRLCSLWGICSDKYRWMEANYDMIFKACVSLTNLHIRTQPLRQNDGHAYSAYIRRLRGIGLEKQAKRVEIQRLSRARRQIRTEVCLLALPGDRGDDRFDNDSDTDIPSEDFA